MNGLSFEGCMYDHTIMPDNKKLKKLVMKANYQLAGQLIRHNGFIKTTASFIRDTFTQQ